MAVSVQFEIGHTAKLRAKKTPEGFTHDWELYVRGTNKADISAYVEKVVFNLHESFQKPKRVYKEPPYVVHESGYASFVLTVDIHFRNRDEPKRVQYPYDLDLQPHGPPHHRSEEKRFVFESPNEEFRQKLLKGGGVPVVPAGLTGSRSGHAIMAPISFAETNTNVQQSSSAAKHKTSSATSGAGETSSKKNKSRTDDTKLNEFDNLFGPLDPSSKNSSSKAGVDTLKNPNSNNNSSGKVLSPNAATSLAGAGVSSLKDRPSKDTKDKQSSSSSGERSKDKSERKEKHKSSSSSSPNKDGRGDSKKSSASNVETCKSEKQRNEDKPKKDKSRDKDRDRSSSGAPNSSGGSSKSTSSSKAVPIPAASSASVPRTSTHGSVSSGSANRIEEKITSASVKSDKETKEKHSSSSSSGKRSKKDKKDKDKDREKDKDKEKDKREEKQRNSGSSHEIKSKEERSHSSASQSNLSGSPSSQSTPNSSLTVQAQIKSTVPPTTVGNSSNNFSTKKIEKESKSSESLKVKSSEKLAEKAVGGATTMPVASAAVSDKKSVTPNSSNSGSSGPKSHKHKKKDKNKEKDKEKDKEKERISTGDREKDKAKEKHKDKVEEKKEIEKSSETISNKLVGAVANEAKKPGITNQAASITAGSAHTQTVNIQASPLSTNNNESSASNKKAQIKEKKSKDSKSSKDFKRRSEASTPTAAIGGESKSKVSKTGTPLSTAGSNIELSDADSRQSSHENTNKAASAPIAPELHSDSSYSSFPDLPVRPKEKCSATPTSTSGIISEKSSKTALAASGSKENKRDKEAKTSAKHTEKISKPEKDDKKRRRNTATSENTFIEPPVKQAKKENKSAGAASRDSTKSPLPSRSSSSVNSAKPGKSLNESNLPDEAVDTQPQLPAQTSINVTAVAATATPSNSNINAPAAVANHANSNNSNNAIAQRNNVNVSATHPASPALSTNDALWPNLSELQELHHKIMTLQDNQDLQQIVEMIAASGCYEVTQRTFDFDLCKLDRGTVERLQEFFATSVS